MRELLTEEYIHEVWATLPRYVRPTTFHSTFLLNKALGAKVTLASENSSESSTHRKSCTRTFRRRMSSSCDLAPVGILKAVVAQGATLRVQMPPKTLAPWALLRQFNQRYSILLRKKFLVSSSMK